MKNTRVLAALAGTALLWSLPARSQSINPGLPDPFRLTEPKNFEAFRSSSNNEDWNSNDDSKRPIPGETITSSRTSRGRASSRTSGSRSRTTSTAGRGCCACASTTTAARCRRSTRRSATSSRSATASSAKVKSLMIRNSSDGRARNSYWPMPFRKSCRITVTNEGRRRVANLYYHVDWEKLPVAARRTRRTSTRGTGSRFRRRPTARTTCSST